MDSELKTILVVDDNAITARWVGYLANRAGYSASLASDGEQALQCLAQEPFVAVISDVDMPGMNGFELLQNIRQCYPDTPVVLMSATGNEELCQAARAYGARAFWEKPVNLDHLASLFGTDADEETNCHVYAAPLLSVSSVR